MKTTKYRQCVLTKKLNSGVKEQVSWIPEKYTVQDKVLKLRDSDGNWENGWVVKHAAGNSVSEDLLPDYHDDIKGHRKATGDSLP